MLQSYLKHAREVREIVKSREMTLYTQLYRREREEEIVTQDLASSNYITA